MKSKISIFIQFLTIISIVVFMYCNNKERKIIDLSGKWNFQIDSLDIGKDGSWYNKNLKETIKLPGSMAINGKGKNIDINTHWTGTIVDKSWFSDEKYAKYRQPGNIKIPFWLQPEKHYIGPAWYQKEVVVPNSWHEKTIQLFLERCHWESMLWIDSTKVGLQNSLGTPHKYDLTDFLTPGKHRITLRIDNRIKNINPGINSHSISDHTQSNWNGIVGKMYLKSKDPVHINHIQSYPDIKNHLVEIKSHVINTTNKRQNVKISIQAHSINSKKNHSPNVKTISKTIKSGKEELTINYPMGSNILLWSEFHPNLYRLTIKLESQLGSSEKTIEFGMREINTKGTQITINGRKTFLRGTLECAIFPETGYPEMDVEGWIKIFKKCKSYGLNHMRFHSWCPPEAAFIAADKVGFYLQVECSSWANQGSSIGDGKSIDEWLYKEAEQIISNYGNHPSFCMLAYGNEPTGKDQQEYLSKFISHWKNYDDRHLYTSAGGWPIIPENDFHSTPGPRIQGWGEELNSIINSEKPSTNWDWSNRIAKYNKPVISHEIGQWCVYPDFSVIEQYTGPLKARNFEIFKETLEKNHMEHLADDFLMASGKLQTLCYKADIEAALRTSGFGGFQLLDLHDFPGQGTALVGVLNAFWQEKGYVNAQEYSSFCNHTVPLVRLEKRTFRNNETLNAVVEIAHYSLESLKHVEPKWQLRDNIGRVLFEGRFKTQDIEIGNTIIGQIEQSLKSIKKPQKIILKIRVADYSNSWGLWVYPESIPTVSDQKIQVVNKLDNNVLSMLQEGENILFTPPKGSLKDKFGGDIGIGFSSIFWNTAWTRGQKPHTLGILCNPDHPALSQFPTEYHSNWQWWDAMSNSNAIILDSFSPELKPVIRIIDDWFENRRLALIFEARIDKGKIIVSGIDLLSNIDDRPAAKQLLYSLKKYMSSKEFNPKNSIEFEHLSKMYNN